MRALVTGAADYLGSRLVWQLHALGHRVAVLSRGGDGETVVDGVTFDTVGGDVTDRASLGPACSSVDVVFHTAVHSDLGPKDPTVLDRVNVDGSRNVFGAAAEAGVPVVHVSTVTAYGPTGVDPQAETYWAEAEPASELERTRRHAHLLAREYQRDGADVRIASVGTVYGPDDPSPLGRLTRLYATVPLPVVPFRDAVWSMVHVDDAADGLVRIAESGAHGSEYVLVAEAVSVKQWAEILAAAVDKPAPLAHVPDSIVSRASRFLSWGVHAAGGPHELIAEVVATASRSYSYSGAKARQELGWNPRPLSVGLAQSVGDRRGV